jgi:hypothetical protein
MRAGRALVAGALVALGALAGGCCGFGPGRERPRTAEEYAAHAAELRASLSREFTVTVAAPFVLVGDGRAEDVRAYGADVVTWAASRLARDLFPLEPAPIVDIWIFNGDESYRRNTSALFAETPSTPYGYTSPCRHALIINAGLGNGTLVHEMVHALLEANFPRAPVWLDEGLASLYEQPTDKDGHLWGLPNWRLPGLQKAIRAHRALPLPALLAASRGEFYDDDKTGLYYAEARYLLYYLQDRGLLVRFYYAFEAAQADDPTGAETLKAMLGEADLAAWQPRWETFVLGLHYP